MKTYIKILPAIFLVAMLVSSCVLASDAITPSKNYITRNYKVNEFTRIDAATVGNIYYTQSTDGKTSVQIYGPDNIVELFTVGVKDNTLLLTMDKENRVKNIKKMKITISSPSLDGIYFKGVGDVNIENGLKTTHLEVESKGVGNVNIQGLTCEDLTVHSMGVGDVKLKGTAQGANLHSKGVGDIEAKELEAKQVDATSKGVGNISCYATESISASAKGVGSIKYKGNPTVKQLSAKGIGSIKNI